MELDELKAGWNVLNKRLAESEVVNLRIVKEMLSQKTKSAFEQIYRLNLNNFLVAFFIACLVFPWIYMNTPISLASFVIVEVIVAIGLIRQIWKLTLLSKFDLEGKKTCELRSLTLHYKMICHREKFWVIIEVSLAMVAFYISELCFNSEVEYVFGARVLITLGLTLMTFALAYVIGLWQRRRHARQMQEIERGLDELKEFED